MPSSAAARAPQEWRRAVEEHDLEAERRAAERAELTAKYEAKRQKWQAKADATSAERNDNNEKRQSEYAHHREVRPWARGAHRLLVAAVPVSVGRRVPSHKRRLDWNRCACCPQEREAAAADLDKRIKYLVANRASEETARLTKDDAAEREEREEIEAWREEVVQHEKVRGCVHGRRQVAASSGDGDGDGAHAWVASCRGRRAGRRRTNSS